VVSQGGGVSPSVGCILEGVATSCSYFLFLICFVRGSPHYFVSVWPWAALFIKRGESLFGGVHLAAIVHQGKQEKFFYFSFDSEFFLELLAFQLFL
jgi:hypothetical protein